MGTALISVKNWEGAGAGKAGVEVSGANVTGWLMADQTLDLFTTTAKDITLSPGYSGTLDPALRAYASGEVHVKGALSQGGF
eukprot:2619361-Alexandrium_andersonii.AAC.1